jgi:hypothetical protein
VRFRNDPTSPTTDSVARQVVSEIKYFDVDTSDFVGQASGRWADSIPPSISSDAPELVDFASGQAKHLLVAVKPLEGSLCYAVGPGKWSKGERVWWFLTAPAVIARIRLRCPYFDQTWSLRFRNLGEGLGLKVFEFRACSGAPPHEGTEKEVPNS